MDSTSDIKSGMAANVTFNFKNEMMNSKTLVVPIHAISEDHNGRFVFVILEEDGNTIVKRQGVTVGDLTTKGFEITSGIQEGQRIATAGLQTLFDGQKVKLQ